MKQPAKKHRSKKKSVRKPKASKAPIKNKKKSVKKKLTKVAAKTSKYFPVGIKLGHPHPIHPGDIPVPMSVGRFPKGTVIVRGGGGVLGFRVKKRSSDSEI
jgi:hypothetical protein